MLDPATCELLSAYLDGEVSDAERVEVETLLAQNAEARQWLDEMRAVGAAMRSLPRQKLPESVAPSVLHAAERHILTGGDLRPEVGSIWATIRRQLNGRRLLWPALAVSIALVMFAQSDQQPDGRPVAKAPPANEAVKEREAWVDNDEGRRVNKWRGSADATPLPPTLSAAPAPAGKQADGVLVVECALAAPAGQSQAFERLLLANSIKFEPDMPATIAPREEKAEVGRVEAMHDRIGVSSIAPSVDAERRADGDKSEPAPSSVELVYVEAMPDQVEAVLAQMAEDPSFHSVSIEPAPGVERQQQYHVYSRGLKGAATGAAKQQPADAFNGLSKQDVPARAQRLVEPPSLEAAAGNRSKQAVGGEVAAAVNQVLNMPAAAPQAGQYRVLFVLRAAPSSQASKPGEAPTSP